MRTWELPTTGSASRAADARCPCPRSYDRGVGSIEGRTIARLVAVVVASLTVASAVTGVLEDVVGVPNASMGYLVAVVAAGYLTGTTGAIATALGAFLLYNFLFTDPRYTFVVADAGALLNVLLLLFVGIVVGQLASMQRLRAELAGTREREARAHFKVSRVLAIRAETVLALPAIIDVLTTETRMAAVWIALDDSGGTERIVTPSDRACPRIGSDLVNVLQRTQGDEPARWVRVHSPTGRAARPSPRDTYRNPDGRARHGARLHLGASAAIVRSTRPDRDAALAGGCRSGRPGADAGSIRGGVGQAEVARQSDALKSALLQSVSHDLRTPLATIRAAAGTLRPVLGVGRRRPAGERRCDRSRGRLPQSTRDEPARPEQDRSRRPARRPRHFRIGRRARAASSGFARGWPDAPLRSPRRPPVLRIPLRRRGIYEHRRERAEPHVRRQPSGSCAHAERQRSSAHDRRRWTGRARRSTLNALRQVLSSPGRLSIARWDRDRAGRGSWLGRGHGRPVSARASELGGLAIDVDLARRVRGIAAERPEPSRARPPGAAPTILLVEDDAETRAALVRDLGGRGYRVEEAATGRVALQRWEIRRPDVILLDLGLPDMDGIEVIGRIRRDASTPIVILSGRYDEREKVEALERGADDYVTKPFGVDELNARLRVALRAVRGGRRAGRIDGLARARSRRITSPGDGRARGPHTARVRDPARAVGHSGRIVTKGRLLRASGATRTRARTATSTCT